jgi:DNA-binding NarL/FixJ family response regulator
MAISAIDMAGRNEPAAIRVLIVADHTLLRASIARLLEDTLDMVVVGVASEADEALAAIEEVHPDLVLMGSSTPGQNRGWATQRIHTAHPEVHILVLSSDEDCADVLDALDAGAVGYLLKDSHPEQLLAGIRAAVSGGSPLAPHAAREVLAAWRALRQPRELTPRGLDVLLLLAEGLPNKVIARRLGIREKTVKGHVTQVFHALGVTDRTQAALWVERHDLSPRQQRRREQLRAEA